MKGVKSGGSGKIGRNKDKCAKYRLKQHREKNKIKRWKKSIKKLPDNNKTCIDLKNKIIELEKVII
ncbi:hypothetical protein LCGC14_1985240 [marine sediment metagenome]|uniref:Uncharacterized protein n=1 Tax=marine sediment metagenome TaxID=412755 RepID=A0A0F9I4S8_9ZZZZ